MAGVGAEETELIGLLIFLANFVGRWIFNSHLY